VPASAGAAPSSPVQAAAVREFDGRVGSVNRSNRSFTVRDLERGTVRIRVTRSTRFERIVGFRGLHRGLLVEVVARSSRGRWYAREVERPGRRRGGDDDGRRRGGDDDRGGDDGRGGDDNGGRGRGGDD
jgi:hypothetical protein